MNAEIKQKLSDVLDKCDGKTYPHICKKLNFVEGKELVINMVYTKLEAFPKWELDNALADVELNLSGINNE